MGNIRNNHPMERLIKGSLLVLLAWSCQGPEIDPLARALASRHPAIVRVMENLKAHEVQIRYTQIKREGDSVHFVDFDFQVDPHRYFYPASTVKFPAAVAALEKLNGLEGLDRDSRFYVEGDSVETTFARSITEIFAVSDNQANNRLLEFLGQDDLNGRMRRRGVAPMAITHRLSVPDAHRVTTRPLLAYLNDSTTTPLGPIINAVPEPLKLSGLKKGLGYLEGDSLKGGPFDFSLKNHFPITAQDALLKRIVFPGAFPPGDRFDLSREQREFLLGAMAILPKEAGYAAEDYPDSFGKFLMFGDSKDPMPDHIKIYNKVGYAYGTLTDCAYIVDTRNRVEFMVTATILVNSDGVFNDDRYDYQTVGIPFLAQLGRELYNYELERKP